ncbi:flagellar protein FlhE [Geopseudomonas aromaticivorans]|nr:flagellar protein FlhE [Pseudomonas aromaticivorans]
MIRLAMLVALLGGLPAVQAAAAEGASGSWQGRAPALLVARSDRATCAQPLTPPVLARGRQLASLHWQFSSPPDAPLLAWLCHPQHCTALSGNRGRTRALAGLDAGQPLQLCFRLPAAGPGLRLADLQLLVEYR